MPCPLPRRRLRRARGFTLVELMYAAALFEIGLIGLVCFQLVSAQATARAREVATATDLAAGAIERGRAVPSSLLLGQTQPIVAYATREGAPATTQDFFTIASRASVPPGVQAYYDLAVQVSWKHAVSDALVHQVAMETYVFTE